jgi:hypothetical protein
MRKKILRGLSLFFLAICILSGASALAEDADISLFQGQEIPTDYINAGDRIDIASDVNGDLILAGSDVSFSGNAAGDIIIGAGEAYVRGDSAGDARIAAGSATLFGAVGKNATVIGGRVIIEEGSIINGNLYVVGGNVEIRGEVKGNVTVYCSELVFSGKTGGDATFNAEKLTVREDALIAGSLTYGSNVELAVPEGVVQGGVNRVPVKKPTDGYAANGMVSAGMVIWQFLALLAIVLILNRFFARQTKEIAKPITGKEFWGRAAFGFLWLILNPVIIAVAIITIIGLPLALILLFFYIVLIIIAFAITPVLLGNFANQKLQLYGGEDKDVWKDFILGYAVMQIVSWVPVLGSFAVFFLFLFAFGRVTKYASEAFKSNR